MNLGHPALLLLLVAVPALAALALIAGRFSRMPWEEFAAERLRGKLVRRDHPLPRWLALGMILAAIMAMVVALARPQGDAGVKTEKTTGRNVMIALDLSRSMRVTDVKPDRLAQAKIVIYELLESLENDRVGLIAFAGSPFLSAPLTIDHGAIRETVEQIDEEWLPRGGSDISAAVKLATVTLRETGQKNNALILISDGEEHEGDLDAIIAEAERSGVTIFAVGVGTEDGGFVPHPDFPNGLVDESGTKVLSRVQPEILRKLAKGTGGRSVIAGRGVDIPTMVESAIEGIDAFEMEGGKTRVMVEFFQWALFPAIFFLMAAIVAGTRWRGIAGLSAVVFLMSSQSAPADLAADARRAFSEKRYDDARVTYRSLAESGKSTGKSAAYRLGEGLSAYNAGDFRGSRRAYSGALLSGSGKVRAKAHEGMGNTLFQLGWVGLSGSRYPQGSAPQDMAVFDELVRGQLKRMAEAEIPDSGETNEYIRFDSIIVNWTDAVRHYRSADNMASRSNGEMTLRYLRRLRELLEEEKQDTEDQMPQPGQGQGQPNEGQPQEGGEGDDPQQGDGGEEPEQGEKEEDEGDKGDGGDNEEKPEEGKEPEGEEGEPDENPNESPEERAGRILSENADLQKGPLSPGRREFRGPEKDW